MFGIEKIIPPEARVLASPASVTSSTRVLAPRLLANSTRFAADAAVARHKILQMKTFIFPEIIPRLAVKSWADQGRIYIYWGQGSADT